MDQSYAQTTTPLLSLRAILRDYSFSVGIFRELLQNSDDAGASRQIFVLDRRTHATESLYHPRLAHVQGPALLAFNDALFQERDWRALSSQYDSSKVNDSSKIGKYGVGFRSVFHVTDCPQILSDNFFALFDPLYAYTDTAGLKKDVNHIASNHPDQLASFEWFLKSHWTGRKFNGTVIRCPLRMEPSGISGEVVHADHISKLFQEFVREEIGICLLFLQNIKQIEIHEVDTMGRSTCLTTLSISRLTSTTAGSHARTHTAVTTTLNNGVTSKKTWRVLQCAFPQSDAIHLLLQASASNLNGILKEHKLLPEVGMAADVTISTRDHNSGRLFTYLPLPIFTKYPVHIHALFAITRQRDSLRNPREVGVKRGSSDHVLIEWNRLLFNNYIPQAWRIFLENIIRLDHVAEIFSFWPPEQAAGTAIGEYCQSLPARLFDFVVLYKSPIWPVHRSEPASALEHKSLDCLITSEPGTSDAVIRILTNMGLLLTCPPGYIVGLVKSSRTFAILTPEEAHRSLLNQVDSLSKALKEELPVILDYLLSTKNVRNLTGLPLIPIANGGRISLIPANFNGTATYTMLTRTEFDVFGSCDENSIPLHHLPLRVAEVLRTLGPESLNVERLEVPRIIEYLTLYPNRLDLDLSLVRTDPRAVKWLSAFWIWISTYARKEELFSQIRHLFLLPSIRGLRKAEAPLFRSRREHPFFVQPLTALGVPFLDGDLHEPAQDILALCGLSKPISDIHALIDSLPSNPPEPLSADGCTKILKHIGQWAEASCNSRGAFNTEQVHKLRNLPIYPVLGFPPHRNVAPGLVTSWTCIPDGFSARSVTNPSFVPVVDGLVFIGLHAIAPNLLKYLEPNNLGPCSDIQLLELAVDFFTTQSEDLQAAVLEYIVRNRQQIPPYILHNLVHAEFVVVNDGSRRKPGDLVDPDSSLAPLYEEKSRQPRTNSSSEKAIVEALKSLRLMKSSLDIDIVRERIEFISSRHSSPQAMHLSQILLSLIGKTNLDYSLLRLNTDQRWLPTDQGVCSSKECRDATQLSPHLFDKVLAVLQPFSIPPSLRAILGWDRPLLVETVIQQLDRVLDDTGDKYVNVLEIIKELGLRDFSPSELESLRTVTKGRKWIPTTTQTLSETMDSVFVSPIPGSGFHQIFVVNSQTKDFLRRMGCEDRPSTDAINRKLKALEGPSLSLVILNVVLSLLRSLPAEMSDDARAKVLIPDSNRILRPFSEIFYNDIGEHASLTPEDHFIAHQDVEEPLARKLNMGRLGLKYADLRIPGDDMGEKPVTTIRNTLKQYKSRQFVIEFLANAADAGATEFTLVANDCYPRNLGDLRVLSPVMGPFCTCPSLIVYNNARFSQQDFNGICRTGIGGKAGNPDTIGEFGLGALTMFHFTELAIVISGTQVLFMNPSKEHLPVPNRASIEMSLDFVRQHYPGHFACIDGLFGFDLRSTDPYDGTVFVLPLREIVHCEGTPRPDVISHDLWSVDRIEQDVHDYFRDLAPNCLLFTGIQTVSAVVRDESAKQSVSWYFHADRTDPVEAPHGFSITDISIRDLSDSTTTWKVAKTAVSRDRIPQEVLAVQHELKLRRTPVAGLAILYETPQTTVGSFTGKFFSMLPLAIPTTLPMHVMASFILSSSRREIRQDDYGVPESKYNHWLLSHVIPPLYLFVLEYLLRLGDNQRWWPGLQRSKEDKEDKFSRLVIEGFYSKFLKESTRRVFYNMNRPSQPLTPSEAILSGDEPSSVEKILSLLQSNRLVRLPGTIRSLAIEKAGVAKVNPTFVKDEILKNVSIVTPDLNFKILEDIIEYLTSKTESPENLLGLPILPLEDGTFGTVYEKSSPICYFMWRPKKQGKQHNFSPRRFIHPRFKVRDLRKLDLNVVPLDPAAVKALIEERLSTFSTHANAFQAESNWINDFWESWDEYSHLGLSHTDVSLLPLVPTIRTSHFVSLEQCKNGTALIVGGRTAEDESIRTCLDALGLNVVHSDDELTPPALRSILRSEDYPSLKFENMLSALVSGQRDVSEIFLNLDRNMQNAFATWARREIPGRQVPNGLLSIAQLLPIWPSARSGTLTAELRSASEVYMLPEGLGLETAAHFMDVYVAKYGNLKYLNPRSITFMQLHERLIFPPTLSAADLVSYRRFIDVWISHLPPSYTDTLLIPNSILAIRPSDELYARDPLFQAAFGTNSENFIHPEFLHLEPFLYKHGLRSENQLDVPMFIACAQTIDSTDGDDRVVRANVLFEAYSTTLPLRVGANEQHLWRQLDDLNFIPRRVETIRCLEDQTGNQAGLEIPTNVTALPDVVTPSELVRSEYESIAWSQRACFNVQPHQRVLLAYPDLGQPSFSEVLAHLRFLSSFQNTSSSQRRIIVHDLEETYKFLNDNVGFVQDNPAYSENLITQLRDERLFLNIDDPATGAWRWDNADSLAFETEDTQSIRYVRRFLLPFEKILLAAGVLRVHHPQYLPSNAVDSQSAKLHAIRSGFNDLRMKNILTDVVFVTDSDDDDGDDDEEDSPLLVAHRSFLAVSSDYFSDSFCGDFLESRDASPKSPVQLNVSEYSRQCVQSVLDYIYTGDHSALNPSLDLLLNMMQLSGYWRIMDLFEDVQREIVNRRLINPDTLDEIRSRAERCQADGLVVKCEEYQSNNPEYIRKVHDRLS